MSTRPVEYILFTSSNFPSGGPGASYLNLFCRGLRSNGADIQVYLLKGHAFGNSRYNGRRKAVSPEGIPFTYLGFRQRPENVLLKLVDQFISMLRLLWVLLSLMISRRRVTVLLYNSDLYFNTPIHLAAKSAGIRLVKFAAEIIDKSQYRKSLLGRISRAAYMTNFRYLNKMSDRLIVFSHYLKNEFLRMGVDEDKIIVQPNLTDFAFWQQEDVDIRYTVGYSGAPYMKDGLHDLLKAFGILADRRPDISLVIIGDATFGRTLIPDLKEECLKLGIIDRVSFTGLVGTEEVRNYLSQCALLAITRPDTVQTRAGFPTKLGEYFSLKKPVLATRFGDMERYFTDGVDIIFAECGVPESIAAGIEWIIDNSRSVPGIVERGHETAKQLLEFNISMSRIMKLLATE
jgi:glycosyltransferase involved in cell wall biosynthesis